ncbi:MAG: MFS transporter [Bradyrhizobium sp.]|uniref:MFS transporter n=1 Tax=Bradyrhizobium sp. TaxID=376 RepID=UPI001208D2CC|nr:MFS transporter [Bradyrhizobium sp.]THD61219.1 MAG: MFS transporter [Bradyrhizobium sp.]
MNNVFKAWRSWQIAILLALFMLINSVDKVVLGLVAIPMMDELGLTPKEFGSIGSSFFWPFVLSGLVGGFFANRYKTKLMILGMVLIWSVCQLPIVQYASIEAIITCRILLGIGQGPAWPVAIHALYKWFPDDKRNMPIAVLALGSGLGLVIAGILIPLITAAWGWRANFVVLAVIGCVWALIWLVVGEEGKSEQEPRSSAPAPVAVIPYLRLLLDRTVLGCIAANFVGYWSLAIGLTWLPAYFERGLGFNGIASGRLYSFVIALTVPFGFGLAWWSQFLLRTGVSSKTARGRFLCCSLILAGFLFALIYISPPGDWIRVALVAIGLGCTPIVYSLSPAILAEVVPLPQRGAMLAINNSIASLAGIAAPFVTAALIQDLSGARGYEAGFALCGGLMILGGIFGACTIDPTRSMLSIRGRIPGPRAALVG